MASILKVDKIRVTGSDSDAISFDGNGVATFNNPPVNVGVSNLQMFRVNTDVAFTTSAATVTAFTDSNNSTRFKRIGTAWTLSSGVFTPSVSGMYEIMLIADLRTTAANRYVQFDYKTSTDSGGSFNVTHTMYAAIPHLNSGTTYSSYNFPRYYNITNATTFRFRLDILAENTSVVLRGGSSNGESILIFKRLADAQ